MSDLSHERHVSNRERTIAAFRAIGNFTLLTGLGLVAASATKEPTVLVEPKIAIGTAIAGGVTRVLGEIFAETHPAQGTSDEH